MADFTILNEASLEDLRKEAERIIENSQFPVVIRSLEKKTGVTVKNQTEAKSVIGALSSLKHPILIEELVKDMISVYVAEPSALAAMKKKSKENAFLVESHRIKKLFLQKLINLTFLFENLLHLTIFNKTRKWIGLQ